MTTLIAITAACMAAGLTGCIAPDDGCTVDGTLQYEHLDSGSGSVLVPDFGYALTTHLDTAMTVGNFTLSGDRGLIDIAFGFGDPTNYVFGTFACAEASSAALLDAPQPVSVVGLCGGASPTLSLGGEPLDPHLGTSKVTLAVEVAAGAFTVVSSLDHSGNGQLSVQLDIPPTDVVATDRLTNMPHTVHVEADHLLGDAGFASGLSSAPACNPQF